MKDIPSTNSGEQFGPADPSLSSEDISDWDRQFIDGINESIFNELVMVKLNFAECRIYVCFKCVIAFHKLSGDAIFVLLVPYVVL